MTINTPSTLSLPHLLIRRFFRSGSSAPVARAVSARHNRGGLLAPATPPAAPSLPQLRRRPPRLLIPCHCRSYPALPGPCILGAVLARTICTTPGDLCCERYSGYLSCVGCFGILAGERNTGLFPPQLRRFYPPAILLAQTLATLRAALAITRASVVSAISLASPFPAVSPASATPATSPAQLRSPRHCSPFLVPNIICCKRSSRHD